MTLTHDSLTRDAAATLDPRLAKALANAYEPRGPDFDVAEMRELFEALARTVPLRAEPVGRVTDHVVSVPGGAIRLRSYAPAGAGPVPVVLYIHGGGWTVGSLESHDDICRSLCRRSGALLVAVDYRRAPEHPFPVPLHDCQAALRWCLANAGSLGGDPQRLALAGDSAGGNLAAALAGWLVDAGVATLACQVLIYPALQRSCATASSWEFATGYGLTREKVLWFWRNYAGQADPAAEPIISPLLRDSLRGLPPTCLLTAHFDPVRDDAEAYGARLRQAGVPVKWSRYGDMNHGFLNYCAAFPQTDRALNEIAAALRQSFAGTWR